MKSGNNQSLRRNTTKLKMSQIHKSVHGAYSPV